jgi:hypothetical protein
MRKPSRLSIIRSLGFDDSEHVPGTKRYRIRCSQCDAMVINGFPTHERTCPNTPRDNDDMEDN